MAISERYSRQAVFKGIGEEGQKALGHSRVAIVGVGALGTVIANSLARAGVGYIRLIDRDFVELSNLQRQTLFNEADVQENLPKAIAAARHLEKVNSEIQLEAVISDANPGNVENLLDGVDLVLDGTDNFETRYVINDVCLKKNIPWIYGGALGSTGMSMNIIPEKTACLRCLIPIKSENVSSGTCSTVGVLNMVTGIVASIEASEAVKILIGSPSVRKNLYYIDLWNNVLDYIDILPQPDCPCCAAKEFEFLTSGTGTYTTSLCGQKAVQVVLAKARTANFEELAAKLNPLGKVSYNSFLLRFNLAEIEITLFPDGRAILKNVENEAKAKSIYTEYFGL